MIYRLLLIPINTVLLLLPIVTNAADIKLFQEGIPFLNSANDLNIENYINALYTAAISVAAILVVIKLILAGVKYMFSEIVTNKEEAKNDIKGALFGLIIILGAVTILNTINPNLTKLNFLEQASRVNVNGTATEISVGGPGPGKTVSLVPVSRSNKTEAQLVKECEDRGTEYSATIEGTGASKAVRCSTSGFTTKDSF